MKLSAKPIFSPGRSDKFPPPLMRFLRSNAGSRSRGRSRASPMFLRKAHRSSTSSVAAETTQEPSSPKVTCMGQVRVGRSKSKKKPQARNPGRAAADDDRPGSRWCGCVSGLSLLCHHPPGRRWRRSWSWSWSSTSRVELRRVSLTRAWRDCSAFFRLPAGRRRRRPDVGEEELSSSKVESEPKFRGSIASSELGEGDDVELKSGEEDEGTVGAGDAACYVASSSPCTPPKNALLLTRCRSAPYRSSSLACRFWGSPLNGVGEETDGEQLRPPPGSEAESKVHPEQEEDEEAEDERFLKGETATVSVAERTTENNGEDSKPGEEEEVVMPRPPTLTRCNSEPARTAAQKAELRCGL